ncbi:Rieske (2Fe-2S) protein [Nocardioides sp. Bht2]|uniref:Rieske (2Fe-2S) protein n=1 Tax=Nocardioides sp. Bht2 TaxID=3392297 RepID=UPI0039B432DF
MTERRKTAPIPRRTVVTVGGLGITAGLLAACSGDGGNGDSNAGTPTSAAPSEPAPSSQAPDGGTSSAPGPSGLVAEQDVPVGSGVILGDEGIVVTQPTSGEFRGFSSTCTHKGCTVGSVTDTINCPCHGSKFAISDGSVVNGPATAPLPEEKVQVKGGQVVRG